VKPATRNWLQLAEKDLRAAEVQAEDEFVANVALFHGQQCVEKSLKAVLEEIGEGVPRIHSIFRLYSRIREITRAFPELSEDDMDFLDSVYIDSRYPSDLGLLPSGSPTRTEAERCVAIDLLVYTLDEWEKLQEANSSFVREIRETGLRIL